MSETDQDGQVGRGTREPGPHSHAATRGDVRPPNSSFLVRKRQSWRAALSCLVVALLAIALYRHALGFAYFNDDPTGHFAWMEGRSLIDFFTSSADYGYYRPVVFATLRLMELLFGSELFPHNPLADHALLLLLHGANAAMVWLLARRLGGVEGFAWVAALLFAFVPFSYESVAYVASLTHPLVVFWTLLALLMVSRLAEDPVEWGERYKTGRWLHAAVLLVTSLGLLTHENGVFIFPALLGADWVVRPRVSWMARARVLWPLAVPPVLFAFLWLAIPKNSDQALNNLADIGRNTIPFLQTLVFPLLPAFRLDSGDVAMLACLAGGTVAGLGLLAWRGRAWRLWVFALGWFALSALPALLFLDPAYVYGSPRLSYLPSIGVALLWGIPVLRVVGRLGQTTDRGLPPTTGPVPATRRLPPVLLVVAYLLSILIPLLPFIRCQLDFYDDTSVFAREMASVAAGARAGSDVLFVNAPFFFSSTAARPDGCPSAYPWTPTGGILIPPYAQPRDFVRFNGGPDRAVAGVTYSGYGPGWRTFGAEITGETLRRHATGNAVYVFDLLAGGFADLSAYWQPDSAADGPNRARFGDVLTLVDGMVTAEGDALVAALDWRVDGMAPAPLAAFVHVYDTSGALVAQSDGPLAAGLAPQELWLVGDGLRDERHIDLSDVPGGSYRVVAGVYDALSGERLAAVGGGQPLADDVVALGTIER